MPIVYSVQIIDDSDAVPVTKRGIIFASSYAEAVKKIESQHHIIVDIYMTTVDCDTIELSEEAYNKLLDGEKV